LLGRPRPVAAEHLTPEFFRTGLRAVKRRLRSKAPRPENSNDAVLSRRSRNIKAQSSVAVLCSVLRLRPPFCSTWNLSGWRAWGSQIQRHRPAQGFQWVEGPNLALLSRQRATAADNRLDRIVHESNPLSFRTAHPRCSHALRWVCAGASALQLQNMGLTDKLIEPRQGPERSRRCRKPGFQRFPVRGVPTLTPVAATHGLGSPWDRRPPPDSQPTRARAEVPRGTGTGPPQTRAHSTRSWEWARLTARHGSRRSAPRGLSVPQAIAGLRAAAPREQ
jgi:hypothetical protein